VKYRPKVIELENNQQKFRNGWRGWAEFLLPLKFGHYKMTNLEQFQS